MSRFLFFAIVLGVYIALDFYAFQGFKVIVRKWLPSYSSVLSVIYWAIPVVLIFVIVAVLLGSPLPTKNRAFVWSVSILLGLFIAKFVWVAFLLIDDAIRLIRFSKNSFTPDSPTVRISRSEFLVTAGALTAGTLFGMLGYGIARGAHNYQVHHKVLKLKKLPSAFKGFKIVQISDIHTGSFWNKEGVRKGVQMILDQKPDAIFFTGDLVNNTSDEFEEYREIFGKLHAEYGIFSVLGNHDYGDYHRWPDINGQTKKQNLQKLKDYQEEMGWQLLTNENRIIEKDGAQLAILGVENWSASSQFHSYGDMGPTYKGVEHIENKLLLSHDPSHWKAEILKDYPAIDAMFSGHTHGMQFGIDTKYYKWSPVKYKYPEWADLYEENGQYLYVNRGFGYLGYPGRVGFLPEITVFELEVG